MVDRPTDMVRQRPEQARSRQRVEEVLAAARDLIAEHGIEPVTITDIATRAGMALTALYRYFPNKQAIVRELAIQTFAHDGRTLVASLLVDHATVEDLVRAGVTTYRERNREEPFRRNLRVAIQADAELAALDIEDNRLVAEALGSRLAELAGRADVALVQETTLLVLSLLDGVIQLTAHLSDAEASRILDTFVRMAAAEVTSHHDVGDPPTGLGARAGAS